MRELLEIVLLGVIEGLTEFLPISSTGHLLIVSRLLGFQQSANGTFEIVIQLGAILAVLGFYWADLVGQARTFPTHAETRRFWAAILIAFLPAAVVGAVLRTWIKAVLFETPTVIAWALILGGVLLFAVERLSQRTITSSQLTHISWKQALGIGVAQTFALIPGVSRSGASIVGGMLAGLDRATATRFSFYLAIPTLGAATLVDLLVNLDGLSIRDLSQLLLGTVVALIVAWFSIGWLLRYVSHNGFTTFAVYRMAAGTLILMLVAIGIL